MRGYLSILFFCFLGINIGFAQEKELDKIRKNYTTGKYEKALKLCDKALSASENKKQPELYYYKSLSTFKQLDSSGSPSAYFKSISGCIAIAAKGAGFDKQHLYFSKENADFAMLLLIAHRQAEQKYYSNKINEAKTLETSIAKAFKDTSDLYKVIYQINVKKEIPEAPVVIKLTSKADKIDSIVYFASTQIGKSYKFGKEGPDAFDCSGFIGYVFKHYNEKLPHNAHLISKLGEEVSVQQIKKGDLVFFGTSNAYHVAMYISDSNEPPKIIHCVYKGVCVDDFTSESHWGKSNLYKVKRLMN